MAFFGKRRPLNEFQTDLEAMLSGKSMQEYMFRFRPFEEEGFVRVQAQQKGFKGSPLVMDLAPGYETPWGPAINLRSRRGAERVFGAEIDFPDLEKGPTLRTPAQNIQQYIQAAYDPRLLGLYPQQGPGRAFERAITTGFPGMGVAGGLLNIGENDPVASRIEKSGRLTVGLGGAINQEAAWEGIFQRAVGAPDVGPGSEFGALRAYAPWRGGDKALRMRRFGTEVRTGDPGEFDFDIMGLGKNAKDILNRLNVSLGGGLREQAQVFGMEEGQMLPQRPSPITGMGFGKRAGFRTLNMLMPGEGEPRSALVQPGTLFTGGTPFPGSMALYRSAAYETGADAFAFPGTESFELQTPHMQQLRGAKFQFGIMKQNAEGAWEKIRDLKGATIKAGTSAVVGTYSLGETTHPLRISAGGSAMFFRGDPQLSLPPAFNIDTGLGTPGVGRQDPRTTRQIGSILPQVTSQFQAGGGGGVTASSRGGAFIDFPVATETDISFKTGGLKAMPFEATGVPQLRGDRGPIGTTITAMTGEQKNPIISFMSEVASLPLPQMSSMFGEFGGELGRQLQMSFSTDVGPGRPGAVVNPENLAQIYAQFRGGGFQEQHTVYQMFDELRGIANQLPAKESFERYGRAQFGGEGQPETPWADIGFVSRAERQLLTQRGVEGVSLATQGQTTGLAAHRQLRDVMRFQPVFPGEEGPTLQPGGGRPVGFLGQVRDPRSSLLGTAVSTPTPEFRAQAPLFGAEEIAAMSLRFPEESKAMGMHSGQAFDASGMSPEYARGWRQIGNIYRHQASGRGLVPEGAIPVTPKLRRQLQRDLFAAGAEESTVGGLSEYFAENIPGGVNPLLNPETGELLEHPATMQAIAAHRFRDPGSGEPLNFEVKQYPRALGAFLGGETRAGGGALRELADRREAIFKSRSRTAMKLMGGRFAPALGGRYGVFTGGEQGEMLISGEREEYLARQAVRASGYKGPRSERQLIRGVQDLALREGGIPSLRIRQPLLSQEFGAQPARLITPDILERRTGIRTGEFPEAQSTRSGGFFAEDIGDFDADYAQMLGLVGVDPASGEAVFKGGRGVNAALAMGAKDRIKLQDQQLKAQLGAEYGVPGGALNVQANAIAEMLTGDKPDASFYTGITPLAGKEEGLMRLGATGGMGRAYNLKRGLMASAVTLGQDPRAIGRGHTGQVQLYQQYLDRLQTSATNIERFAQSAILTTDPSGKRGQMMAIGAPGTKHRAFWQSEGAQSFEKGFGDVLTRLVEGDIAQGRISPESAGFMFSMPGQDPAKLASRIRERGPEALGGLPFDPNYNVLQTPIGLTVFSTMMERTFGSPSKEARQIQTKEGPRTLMEMEAAKQIPINLGFGQTGTLGSLGRVREVRMQQALYQAATRRGGPPSIQQGQLLSEELNRRRAAGEPIQHQLEYTVNQFGLTDDPNTMLRQEISLAATRQPRQEEAPVTQKPTADPMTDPMFMMPPQEGRFPTRRRGAAGGGGGARSGPGRPFAAGGGRGGRSGGGGGNVGIMPPGPPLEGGGFPEWMQTPEGMQQALRGAITFGGPRRSQASIFEQVTRSHAAVREMRSPQFQEEMRTFRARAAGMLSGVTGTSVMELMENPQEFAFALGQALEQDPEAVMGFARQPGMAQTIKTLATKGRVIERGVRASAGMGTEGSRLGQMIGELRDVSERKTAVGRTVSAATGFGEVVLPQLKGRGESGLTPNEMTSVGRHLDDFEKSVRKVITANEDLQEGTIKRGEAEKRIAVNLADAERSLTRGGAIRARGELRIAQQALETAREEGTQGEVLAAGDAVSTSQRKLLRAATAQQKAEQPTPTGAERALGGFRRAIGGWGLFYMRHLLGLGLGPMQQGFQEYQEFAQQQAGLAVQTFGPGAIPPFVSTQMQRQTALVRAGGGAFGALQAAGTGLIGTPLQDIGAAGLFGVGAMGLTAHLGGALGLPATTISGLAGPIGLGVAGAALLGQGFGYAVNRDQTAITSAAAGATGGLGEITQYWRSWWTGPSGMAESNKIEASVEMLARGQAPQGLSERDKARVAQAFGATTIPGLGHIDPNTQGQIALWALESGRHTTVEEMARVGSAIQSGIPIQALAQQISRFSGVPALGPTAYFDAIVDLSSNLGEDEQASLTAGVGLMQRTPGIHNLIREAGRGFQFGPAAPSGALRPGMPSGLTQSADILRQAGQLALQAHDRGPQLTQEQLTTVVAQRIFGRIEGGAGEAPFLRRADIRGRERALGLPPTPIDFTSYFADQMRTDQMRQQETVQNMIAEGGMRIQQNLLGMGATFQQLEGIVPGFRAMGMRGINLADRVIRGDPIAMTAIGRRGGFGDLAVQGVPLNQVLAAGDIGVGGAQTGLPWGTTGLQRGDRSAVLMGLDIFGLGAFEGQGAGAQAARGATLGLGEEFMGEAVPEFMQGQGGMRALQFAQRMVSRQASRAAAGSNIAMLQLQGRYQPMFWAIQDQQRALSDEQAQFGFGMQQRQFELQGRQFRENVALSRTGTLMQRGFTIENQRYQDQVRTMQFGFRQEDFAENVRFMSGRQRRLAERGMERETVMFGMEGDQISRQREQQQAVWRLEDERHQLNIKHFDEGRALQLENMQKQKEFYEDGKRLQDEMIKLQREYWKEQHALQLAAAGAQASYAEQLHDIQDLILQQQIEQEKYNGLANIARSDSDLMIDAIISGLNYVIRNAPRGLASIISGLGGGEIELIPPYPGGGSGSGGTGSGGGSAGEEAEGSGAQEFGAWNNAFIPGRGGRAGQQKQINIFIGNEKLSSYVLDTVKNDLEVA